ncbi:LOW QUALITY PROTEIN: hypothetical protein HID58_080328 [Brassica napus]|uniref:Fumarylacetoacetase-like C-terminal domain-containing protein n=2 Tax=Brassica napus TaxID=3708 RepID=A0ABQ7Y4L2_BRANA|nr:LOW QUALITY PROTEIN: hypothetical protein HID58_080328 [Brassica napus]
MSEGRIKKSVNGGAPAQTNPDDRRSSVEASSQGAGKQRAVIKSADMKEDMQKEAIDIAITAFEKNSVEKEIAENIKKEFDKKHGATWHCIVGRNFGSYVTHETNHFVYFYLDQKAVLLFKSEFRNQESSSDDRRSSVHQQHFKLRRKKKRRIRSEKMTTSMIQRLFTQGTKIVCVGRNYAAHAKELGNAVPKEPVIFLKPTSSYLENGGTIEIPHPLESLHHEVELAVVMGEKARDVPEATAMDYIGGYAVALDMTARELQASAKASGLPWTLAKGHDTFTPISSVLPKAMVHDPDNLELWLKVDGETRQKGLTKDMIFKVPYLISYISSIMTLYEGDVILTGTPEGVGPVKIGQKITAGITGLSEVQFDVDRRVKPLS